MTKDTPVEQLDKAIKERGWTQNEAERRLGFPTGIIAAWRHGIKRPGPLFRTVMEKALGIPADIWFSPEEITRINDVVESCGEQALCKSSPLSPSSLSVSPSASSLPGQRVAEWT